MFSHVAYSYIHHINQRAHSVSAFVGWYGESRKQSLSQLEVTTDITSWNRVTLSNWQSFSWTRSRNWTLSKTFQSHYTLYFAIHPFTFLLSVPASAKCSHLPEDFRSPVYMIFFLPEAYIFLVAVIIYDMITIWKHTQTDPLAVHTSDSSIYLDF